MEVATRSNPESKRRRGLRGQRQRRRREREVREAAVAGWRCLMRHGVRADEAARQIGIHPRTLRRWRRRWREDRLAIRLRGRPPDLVNTELRAKVFATLREFGPGIGVPALRNMFPEAGKRELQELVRRYRHAYRRGRRLKIHALRWREPGSVWAMDFTDPPLPIEGIYDKLLCVRDLPSEKQLSALPTIGKRTKTVIQLLEALTRWHGAPLVLKLDNDGSFRSDEIRAWSERNGVKLLYSPPRTPRYNGAIEAGIGRIKVGAHYASALRDHPGEWTCDDVEKARRQMNHVARPRGVRGPSACQLWAERNPLADAQRADFNREYRRAYALECAHRGIAWGVELQHADRSSVDRAALARTLTKMGFLLFRRRRITLSLQQWKTDRITR